MVTATVFVGVGFLAVMVFVGVDRLAVETFEPIEGVIHRDGQISPGADSRMAPVLSDDAIYNHSRS